MYIHLQHRQTDYNNSSTEFDFTDANYELVRAGSLRSLLTLCCHLLLKVDWLPRFPPVLKSTRALHLSRDTGNYSTSAIQGVAV